MAFEKIDQAKESASAFDKLVADARAYLDGDMSDPKVRLQLERRISKYAEQNTSDWLLNLIICVDGSDG